MTILAQLACLPLMVVLPLPCASALQGPADLAGGAATELSSCCPQVSCIGGM